MIVYGWNAKIIKQASLESYECPGCQQKQSDLIIAAKYIHIFWIPVFPFKKTALIVCKNCRHESDEKNITLGSKDTIKQLKAAVPIPKYLFSGLALIILAIGYFTYSGIKESEQEQAYVDDPHVGDVYLIKDREEPSEFNHYLIKVRDIAGDSLWVSYSSFSYNGTVSQLDPKDGFYDLVFTIHKNTIQEFNDSGDLKKVMRDYETSAGFDREIEFQLPDSIDVN